MLPQNILGALLFLALPIEKPITPLAKKGKEGGFFRSFFRAWKTKSRIGVSLGFFSFVSTEDQTTLLHERGHFLQSLILGPFYLIIVGIPSAIIHLFDKIFHKNWGVSDRIVWYFRKFPENWADSLEGLSVNDRLNI
jgi:hypothetical protein